MDPRCPPTKAQLGSFVSSFNGVIRLLVTRGGFGTWQASTPPWRKPAQIIRGVMKLLYIVGLEHLAWSTRGTEAFCSEGETFPGGQRCRVLLPEAGVRSEAAWGGFLTILLQVAPTSHSHGGSDRKAEAFGGQTHWSSAD